MNVLVIVCYGTPDAAALMLKEKIHRIPIVNENDQVIGEYTFEWQGHGWL